MSHIAQRHKQTLGRLRTNTKSPSTPLKIARCLKRSGLSFSHTPFSTAPLPEKGAGFSPVPILRVTGPVAPAPGIGGTGLPKLSHPANRQHGKVTGPLASSTQSLRRVQSRCGGRPPRHTANALSGLGVHRNALRPEKVLRKAEQPCAVGRTLPAPEGDLTGLPCVNTTTQL